MKINPFLLFLFVGSSVLADNPKHWFLSYSPVGGKETKIELDSSRFDFKNSIGQECWVSEIKFQENKPDPVSEERSLVCKIDSKNMVATTFACWAPHREFTRRSFVLSRLVSSKKDNKYDTAGMILTCHEKAPWTK